MNIPTVAEAFTTARAKTGLSTNALKACARFWHGGVKHTVTSHSPHAVRTTYGQGFDELVTAGIITKVSFNDHDSWTYNGTPESHRIGWPLWQALSLWYLEHDDEPDYGGEA